MLVENEKVGISSHQWPQEPILLPPFSTAPSSTAAPAAAMVHHQDHSSAPTTAALNCPRCDSSNTKFCYYNNYSLSQPRHFCKACKRYWTRGGTLRNVPVGGGCRKNTKRRPQTKSSSSSSVPAVSSSSPSPLNLPTSLPNIAPPAAYNMPTAADMSLAFPSLRPYDVQPQLDALSGLGFTSSQFGAEINQLSDYQQFGSLLASSLRPPNKSDQHYHSSLLPYEDPQATGNLGLMKEVKVEGDYSSIMSTNINRVEEWQLPSNDNPYETLAADHSSSCLYWNVPGWPDAAAANCGSSIAPLI